MPRKLKNPTSHPGAANPLAVDVTRGDMVESRHRAAVAVVDAAGRTVGAWGDVARPVYGRSAMKPLQALPLIETGAAERYGLGLVELALAAASHNGEPRHVELVSALLARIGCGAGDLECGAHWPLHPPTAEALMRAGGEPGAVHNNCSGQHAGFLATARHLGEPTKGYADFGHPVQLRVQRVLEEMTDLDLAAAPRGIDGCGIPVIGIPLHNMALAMARMADPSRLTRRRAEAARRILAAMTAEPFLVGGTDEFASALMTALGPGVVVKGGAEGVFTAALADRGIGIALKVDDGATRAAQVALGRVLSSLGVLSDEQQRRLAGLLAPPVVNRAMAEVGRVHPAADCPF